MSGRAVFFDIDGTLWNYEQKIPESLQEAVDKLHAAGNYGFICTGRTRGTVFEENLLGIGFDGIIAGCGTHVEMRDEILYERYMTPEELHALRDVLKGAGIGIFAEGSEKLYIDWDYFDGQAYAEGFRKRMGENCRSLAELDAESKVNKLSIDFLGKSVEEVCGLIDAERYDVIVHDLTNMGDGEGPAAHVAEIVPKGFNKATGIQWLCNHLEIDQSRTYAFGDGSNDLDMLHYVACGIAMGNGNEAAKSAADRICEAVMEDGIYKEMGRLGLYIRM